MKKKKNKYDLEHSQFKYQPDDRICAFYVTERVQDIIAIKDGAKAHKELYEFYEEMVRNIGIDAIHKHNN
jgi:hypothetical protein